MNKFEILFFKIFTLKKYRLKLAASYQKAMDSWRKVIRISLIILEKTREFRTYADALGEQHLTKADKEFQKKTQIEIDEAQATVRKMRECRDALLS